MNAKEYLEQYRAIRLKLVQLNDRILSIETEASHLNYREDKIIKAMERMESLEEKKRALVLRADEIKENVGKVDDPLESMVLWLRYIEPHPKKPYAPLGWREIGKRINYSQEGAKKIHLRALKHLSEKCTES